LSRAVRSGSAAQEAHRLTHVTWKFATSVDGRSAAAAGSSQMDSEEARGPTSSKGPCDAIGVGTETDVLRRPCEAAACRTAPGARQRLRVVGVERNISEQGVLKDESRTMVIRTRIRKRFSRPYRIALTCSEGGPTLAVCFCVRGESPDSCWSRQACWAAPPPTGKKPQSRRGRAVHRKAQRWRFDGTSRWARTCCVSLGPGLYRRWRQRADLIEHAARRGCPSARTAGRRGSEEGSGLHREGLPVGSIALRRHSVDAKCDGADRHQSRWISRLDFGRNAARW